MQIPVIPKIATGCPVHPSGYFRLGFEIFQFPQPIVVRFLAFTRRVGLGSTDFDRQLHF